MAVSVVNAIFVSSSFNDSLDRGIAETGTIGDPLNEALACGIAWRECAVDEAKARDSASAS